MKLMSNCQKLEINARLLRRQAGMIAAALANDLGHKHPTTQRMQAIVQELAGVVCDIGDAAELSAAFDLHELNVATAFAAPDRYDLTQLKFLDKY